MKNYDMDTQELVEELLTELFTRAKAQFGSAVKSYWFYDGDPCPGCGFPVDAMKYKGQDALSLNAFIYRPRGVLIGYLLCGLCAQQIFEMAQKNPYVQTPLHAVIEQNLIKAYQRYLASLDA
jgi:hypothetical protein